MFSENKQFLLLYSHILMCQLSCCEALSFWGNKKMSKSLLILLQLCLQTSFLHNMNCSCPSGLYI